jgi:hypothetical protein
MKAITDTSTALAAIAIVAQEPATRDKSSVWRYERRVRSTFGLTVLRRNLRLLYVLDNTFFTN